MRCSECGGRVECGVPTSPMRNGPNDVSDPRRTESFRRCEPEAPPDGPGPAPASPMSRAIFGGMKASPREKYSMSSSATIMVSLTSTPFWLYTRFAEGTNSNR